MARLLVCVVLESEKLQYVEGLSSEYDWFISQSDTVKSVDKDDDILKDNIKTVYQ